jgi:hypothetical protein
MDPFASEQPVMKPKQHKVGFVQRDSSVKDDENTINETEKQADNGDPYALGDSDLENEE